MSRSHILAVVLFAIGMPLATWMHGRATNEGIRLAQADDHAADARALDTNLRRARTERFLAEVRDPSSSCATRRSALHFLADEDHEDPQLRAWAKQELDQLHCRTRYDDALPAPVATPRAHDDVVKLFGNLERNTTLKALIRLGLEPDQRQRF